MRVESPAFMEFVATLGCRMRMHDPCSSGPSSEAHRTGASDLTAIPLCRKHRLALVTNQAPFSTMGAEGRLRWELAQVSYVRRRWMAVS